MSLNEYINPWWRIPLKVVYQFFFYFRCTCIFLLCPYYCVSLFTGHELSNYKSVWLYNSLTPMDTFKCSWVRTWARYNETVSYSTIISNIRTWTRYNERVSYTTMFLNSRIWAKYTMRRPHTQPWLLMTFLTRRFVVIALVLDSTWLWFPRLQVSI